MGERAVFFASEEEGLERVRRRIEDRRRDALNEWKVLLKRGVDGSYFVHKVDTSVERTKAVFVIEHER